MLEVMLCILSVLLWGFVLMRLVRISARLDAMIDQVNMLVVTMKALDRRLD